MNSVFMNTSDANYSCVRKERQTARLLLCLLQEIKVCKKPKVFVILGSEMKLTQP